MPTPTVPALGQTITCDNCGVSRVWGGVWDTVSKFAYCQTCVTLWSQRGGVGLPTDAVQTPSVATNLANVWPDATAVQP